MKAREVILISLFMFVCLFYNAYCEYVIDELKGDNAKLHAELVISKRKPINYEDEYLKNLLYLPD